MIIDSRLSYQELRQLETIVFDQSKTLLLIFWKNEEPC